jgi:hypothetical protein
MHAPAIAVATRRMIVPAAVAFLVALRRRSCRWLASAGIWRRCSRASRLARSVCEHGLCCGQARRRAGFPGHVGPGGPGRLPGFAQRFLPAALIRAVVTQPVGAGAVFPGSAGLAAFT